MAKPSSSATLDTGHALATNMVACWPFLEGTGTSSADKTGNGRAISLDAGAVSWSSDGGDAVVVKTDNTNRGGTLASDLVVTPTTSSFSIAWRAKQAADDTAGVVLGFNSATTPIINMSGSSDRLRYTTAAETTLFTKTLFTTTEDHVLTWDQATGNVRYYVNGVQNVDSPIVRTGSASLTFNSILGGHSGALNFVGTFHYMYVWDGRVISGAEAATLAADPYAMFTDGATDEPVDDLETVWSIRSRQDGTDIVAHVFEWLSNSSGIATLVSGISVSGQIERVVIVPSSVVAPTADYDVTLTDEDGIDVLAGQGADLSSSVKSVVCPGTPLTDGTTTSTVPVVVDGLLTLNVSNAGDSKAGRVVVYVK